MIKRLKNRFILLAVAAVGIIFFFIIGIINVVNQKITNDNLERVLTILLENEGEFPAEILEAEDRKYPIFGTVLSRETPFETRYFTVTLDEEGDVITSNTSKIVSVNNIVAEIYAASLFEQEKFNGGIDYYRFGTVVLDDGNILYVFIDYAKQLSVVDSFLKMSIIFGIIGLIAVYGLMVLLSRIVIKPVEESYSKQKSFITNSSHDIKTPLTIISADTELVEMENGSSQWTNDIKDQVKRLTSLTNKLVFLSKMEEEDFTLDLLEVNISSLLQDVVSHYEPLITASNKKIEVDIENNILIKANEDKFNQMMYLLFDNAIKYSSDNATIKLGLKQSNKQIELTLENDVDFIEEGNHDELFDRFYRLDSSRNSNTGGHGIGLSVVKAIALSHKGKISCKSENTQSIKFTIIFNGKTII